MNSCNYVKIPLRSTTTLDFAKDDKYCFLWSLLAHLPPCNVSHPNRVSNYREYFKELNID